jgi:hypothetical protein
VKVLDTTPILAKGTLTSPLSLSILRLLSDCGACDLHQIANNVLPAPVAGCAKPAPVPGDPGAVQMVPPTQLTRVTCDLARYYLYDDIAPEHEVYLRYKAAERELLQIAEGKAVLTCSWGGVPGLLVAGDAPGDAEVLYGFSARQITDDSTRGYA